jgi:hypothetical protein
MSPNTLVPWALLDNCTRILTYDKLLWGVVVEFKRRHEGHDIALSVAHTLVYESPRRELKHRWGIVLQCDDETIDFAEFDDGKEARHEFQRQVSEGTWFQADVVIREAERSVGHTAGEQIAPKETM